MLKLVSSVLAGLALGVAIVFATDAAFHALSPIDAVPDQTDREAMRAYVAAQPLGVLALMIAGWTLAAFAGAAFASRLGERGELPGWIVTALFLLATVANFAMVPHPAWMAVIGISAIVLAGWLGAHTERRRLRAAGR